ncbi:MAG: tyrosine-type recombinase/integrase [Thermodesulfobacteriota bacterium]|nr:tyrosine-type recombinase/integrase [Thermodesulfobacteriota bacterium]
MLCFFLLILCLLFFLETHLNTLSHFWGPLYRHSGASLMDNNNVPIGAIQKILGHENRTTTEIYLHNMGDLERQAMDIFEIAR